MKLGQMAVVFFFVGMMSFGGGWTTVGLLQTQLVGNGWISALGFGNIVAIAQITPGPVSINTATLIGIREYGIVGGIILTLAVVAFPLLAIVAGFLLSKHLKLDRGRLMIALGVGTLSMLALTLLHLLAIPAINLLTIAIGLSSFFLVTFTKINNLIPIFAGGAISLTWYLLNK